MTLAAIRYAVITLPVLALSLLAGPAGAQPLSFPSTARLQAEEISPAASYQLPLGIWDRGEMPRRTVEGRKTLQAWRIAAPSLTVLQLARPLRDQLQAAGFEVIFECQTEACGGFDFRFAVETLPPPEMRINIGDFRFLAARRLAEASSATGENLQGQHGGGEYVTLFLSRTAEAGFVQVTHLAPAQTPFAAQAAPALTPSASDGLSGGLSSVLETQGRAVLSDLSFATGSAQLAEARFASLSALASYLRTNPGRSVALVGHTDSAGALAANIALSKRRATSVLERLATVHSIPRRQMEAEGMGYLAPLASNLTPEGRQANRRVEVILTTTDP